MGEIKRRRVFQVAVVYAVVAWLLAQIVDVINEPLGLPGWFDTAIIVALAIGFPIAMVLAWAFDITPQGVVRTSGAKATENSSDTVDAAAPAIAGARLNRIPTKTVAEFSRCVAAR